MALVGRLMPSQKGLEALTCICYLCILQTLSLYPIMSRHSHIFTAKNNKYLAIVLRIKIRRVFVRFIFSGNLHRISPSNSVFRSLCRLKAVQLRLNSDSHDPVGEIPSNPVSKSSCDPNIKLQKKISTKRWFAQYSKQNSYSTSAERSARSKAF